MNLWRLTRKVHPIVDYFGGHLLKDSVLVEWVVLAGGDLYFVDFE